MATQKKLNFQQLQYLLHTELEAARWGSLKLFFFSIKELRVYVYHAVNDQRCSGRDVVIVYVVTDVVVATVVVFVTVVVIVAVIVIIVVVIIVIVVVIVIFVSVVIGNIVVAVVVAVVIVLLLSLLFKLLSSQSQYIDSLNMCSTMWCH